MDCGKSHAVLELTELVKKHSPSIVFLTKTKLKDKFLKNLCQKLQLENLFLVPRNNTGGGLYWKNWVDIHVQRSSPSFIDAVVKLGVDDAGVLQVCTETSNYQQGTLLGTT